MSRRPSRSENDTAVSSLELRERQADRIPLNADHNAELELGQIMALRRSDGGDCWACATAEADRLLELEQPIYFSAETTRRAIDDGDIVITGAALCLEPATVSLQPVELLEGGLDRRSSWVLHGFRKELVEQAVERYQRYRPGPLYVRDAATEALLDKPVGEQGVLVGDQLVARRGRTGPWRHGPPGKILRVR
jgi:hypothetical protein